MRREERGGLVAYRFETLPGAVEALVSTRHGGVSPPPHDSLNLGLWTEDEAAAVVENRRRLFAAFELPFERSVWCRQVHSDGVVAVGEADAGRGAADEASVVPDADAMVTDTPGLPLCVKVADCVPVVVADPERAALGLAHAGWGGTVARICSATVAAMGERFGSDPATLHAAVDPSIGPAGYEVGAEVIERAEAAYGERAAELLRPRGGPARPLGGEPDRPRRGRGRRRADRGRRHRQRPAPRGLLLPPPRAGPHRPLRRRRDAAAIGLDDRLRAQAEPRPPRRPPRPRSRGSFVRHTRTKEPRRVWLINPNW